MKNWFLKNEKNIIISAFVIPIIIVAIISISHVTQWYGISNPISWALYLSVGIEIAALSSLAAISARMGKNVYFPFIVVTLIQFIGNIFFSYSYINVNSIHFKNWVELVSPLVNFIGVEPTDLIGHKRFLSFFAGGILPIISLSFLHMLIKFTEKDDVKQTNNTKESIKDDINDDDIMFVDLNNITDEEINTPKKSINHDDIFPDNIESTSDLNITLENENIIKSEQQNYDELNNKEKTFPDQHIEIYDVINEEKKKTNKEDTEKSDISEISEENDMENPKKELSPTKTNQNPKIIRKSNDLGTNIKWRT